MIMLSKPLTVVLALAFSQPAATAAVPAQHSNDAVIQVAGDFTFYNTGLGACGTTNNDNEFVAAVGHGLFDRTRPCGRRIRIHFQGRSAVVRVVDRCGGCNDQSLDLSPAAFKSVVGSLGPGRVKGTWEFI